MCIRDRIGEVIMTKEDIIKPENLVAKKPTLMNDNPMHYCTGCSHGVVHKLIAEVIEEMGLGNKSIGIDVYKRQGHRRCLRYAPHRSHHQNLFF